MEKYAGSTPFSMTVWPDVFEQRFRVLQKIQQNLAIEGAISRFGDKRGVRLAIRT